MEWIENLEHKIANLTQKIQLNPNDYYAYTNRGLAYNNLKQYERAIQDLNKAIQINPNYDYAYINRGLSYHYLGQDENKISIRLFKSIRIMIMRISIADFLIIIWDKTKKPFKILTKLFKSIRIMIMHITIAVWLIKD